MKPIIIALFAFLPLAIFGQDCDCAATFDWVKKTFEENDAGFQYIVDKKGEQAYTLHNQIYLEKTNAIHTAGKCQASIRDWLSFFRQAHVEFHYLGEIEPEADEEAKPEEDQEGSAKDGSEKLKDDPHYQLHTRYLNASTPFVERLNPNTLYLRIPSFQANQKQVIDSTIAANRAEILRTENLIIDIRNGTGGSDISYAELTPFIYTNPIRMPTVEFRSTPLNNQRMHEMATNTGIALQFGLNPSEEEMKEYQADYDKLTQHIGEFVNLSGSNVSITKLDTIYPYPSQVGILINQNNVSTDEQFILEAKQSKKVKFFGATTMGGLDVSNLYLTYSPAKDFLLVYALSKSRRIPDMVVDDIGIKPDFYIDGDIPEHEWIKYVTDVLNE